MSSVAFREVSKRFGEVEAVGVNVEDIAIEHDTVREVGYLALSVAPEAVDALVASMLAHGWTVSE